jgi:flavin-dependent dehydrogenase
MKKLKIAIVGMGVAGSYLINQLSKRGHEVTGYERYTEQNFECVCAWGTSRYGISRFTQNCDLDFEQYVIHEGFKFRMEYRGNQFVSDVTGLVTFDKHQMVLDMQKGHKIIYNKWIRSLEEDYDMIIDATGGIRALLPKIHEDLLIPVVQYRVKFDKPPIKDFYLKMFDTNSGYFWYFPLGDGEAHIGAGDYYRRHIQYIDEFVRNHPCKRTKIVGRPIRLVPPCRCEPFYHGKIVGVGESIGTVFPLAGEGIIPSLQCADLFLENMDDFHKYRRAVLRHFQIYDDAGLILESLLSGKFAFPADMIRMVKVGNEIYRNPKRYGVSMNPTSLVINNPLLALSSINLDLKL